MIDDCAMRGRKKVNRKQNITLIEVFEEKRNSSIQR